MNLRIFRLSKAANKNIQISRDERRVIILKSPNQFIRIFHQERNKKVFFYLNRNSVIITALSKLKEIVTFLMEFTGYSLNSQLNMNTEDGKRRIVDGWWRIGKGAANLWMYKEKLIHLNSTWSLDSKL